MSNSTDTAFMLQALELSRPGLGKVWPNPSVGCVITRAGQIIAQAATGLGGRPHAETWAIDSAGARAQQGTAYITLEPCSHWGRTPPCTDALIQANLRRVVIAVGDPDPRVNGKGIAQLRDAGLEVETGVCSEQAREINAGFFMRIETGRPLVTATTEPIESIEQLVAIGDAYDVCLVGLERAKAWHVGAAAHIRVLSDPELARELAALGEQGLTRALVAADDPIAPALRKAGLIDRLIE